MLEPLTVMTPFHSWVICWPLARVQFKVQLEMAALPALTVTVPWKPPGHGLTRENVAEQAPVAGGVVVTGGVVTGGVVVTGGRVVTGGVVTGGVVVTGGRVVTGGVVVTGGLVVGTVVLGGLATPVERLYAS